MEKIGKKMNPVKCANGTNRHFQNNAPTTGSPGVFVQTSQGITM